MKPSLHGSSLHSNLLLSFNPDYKFLEQRKPKLSHNLFRQIICKTSRYIFSLLYFDLKTWQLNFSIFQASELKTILAQSFIFAAIFLRFCNFFLHLLLVRCLMSLNYGPKKDKLNAFWMHYLQIPKIRQNMSFRFMLFNNLFQT